MKVKCHRAALADALQLAVSVVPSRTPQPILQCAKLEARSDNTLTIAATDNELGVKYTLSQVEVDEPGVGVVPADRLTAIVRESTDETLTLEMKDSTCQVAGKDSCFHVYGHDPDDFPELGDWQGAPTLAVNAKVLCRMIHCTSFAAARENTRYAINGVLWEAPGKKKLTMVATDGRRLAHVNGETVSSQEPEACSAIVPVKTMIAAERILTDPEEKIEISVTANKLRLTSERAELYSSLIQGRFPKYTDVIPTGCSCRAQIEVEPLRSAVRRAALLATEQASGVLLDFNEAKLCISSRTPEAGDAEVTMAIRYQGKPVKIGFNPQYLLELLRVVDEPEVVMEFEDGSKPGLVRSGKDFQYVLMPVTV